MNGTVRNILSSPLWLFLHGAAFLPLPVLYVISDVLGHLHDPLGPVQRDREGLPDLGQAALLKLYIHHRS